MRRSDMTIIVQKRALNGLQKSWKLEVKDCSMTEKNQIDMADKVVMNADVGILHSVEPEASKQITRVKNEFTMTKMTTTIQYRSDISRCENVMRSV